MIFVDHTVTVLTILVTGEDIEDHTIGGGVHGKFKFQTIFPLFGLLLRDLEESARV